MRRIYLKLVSVSLASCTKKLEIMFEQTKVKLRISPMTRARKFHSD